MLYKSKALKHLNPKTTKTRYGYKLSDYEIKAFKTIKRIIEHDEENSNNHEMADIFRSYFK